MSVLFFWTDKNYRQDINDGSAFSYHLNQNSVRLFNLMPGEHVWAFTRRPDHSYVLAADLVVRTTGKNQANKYGAYYAEGNKQTTRYFDINKGLDIEPLIRSLSFKPNAAILGQSFRGRNAVRKITVIDEKMLNNFSQKLPIIP
jgi:hypothetical protein